MFNSKQIKLLFKKFVFIQKRFNEITEICNPGYKKQ